MTASALAVRPTPRLQPLALLGACGLALATVVALAKVAFAQGLTSIDFAAAASAGAALLLTCIRRRAASLPAAQVRPGQWWLGCAMLAVVSYALPNVAQAWVAGHVGAAHASMMLALTPLITLALVTALRMEPVRRDTLVGLLLGLAGTWLLIAPRVAMTAGAVHWNWLAAGLIAPTANAAGNVIRSRVLPQAGSPVDTVRVVLLMAAACLLPLAFAQGLLHRLSVPAFFTVAVAGAVTAGFNVLLFRLQVVAGAVRLSQLGYVAAMLGVALSAVVFHEALHWNLLAAVVLIVAGVQVVERRRGPQAR